MGFLLLRCWNLYPFIWLGFTWSHWNVSHAFLCHHTYNVISLFCFQKIVGLQKEQPWSMTSNQSLRIWRCRKKIRSCQPMLNIITYIPISLWMQKIRSSIRHCKTGPNCPYQPAQTCHTELVQNYCVNYWVEQPILA